MNRLAMLVAATAIFGATPAVVARLLLLPRWRARVSFLALMGLGLSVVSLLAVILVPEVMVVSSWSEIWTMCSRAFDAILTRPLGRLPSIVAGAGLAVVLGRFVWSLAMGVRATRRARVAGGEPRWRLAGKRPVYVLPLDQSAAYSVGWLRGQAVVSEGLLALLDDDEVRAVLLHEEAHLRGRHHAVLLVARGIGAALSFVPPVQAALAQLERALEESADDYAASRLGTPAVASSLSKAALAGLRGPVGALSLAKGLDVPARVRRLLVPDRVPAWAPVASLALLGVLLAALAMTQAVAGLALVAATHHVVGLGTAATCPLTR